MEKSARQGNIYFYFKLMKSVKFVKNTLVVGSEVDGENCQAM